MDSTMVEILEGIYPDTGCYIFLDADETQMHEWDLQKLVQKSLHLVNNEWKIVKWRSIRRIHIDRAPQQPFG